MISKIMPTIQRKPIPATQLQSNSGTNIAHNNYFTCSFEGNDQFVRHVINESTPMQIRAALTHLNQNLFKPQVEEVNIKLSEDENPLIELKNMCLSAKKTKVNNKENITIQVSYNNGDNKGYSVVANRTPKEIVKMLKSGQLLSNIKNRLKYMSDKLSEEPEIIDLKG